MRKNLLLYIFIITVLGNSCTLIKESRNKKKLAEVEYERQYPEDEYVDFEFENIEKQETQDIPSAKTNFDNQIWYHPNPWWRIETTPFPVSKDSVKIRRYAPQYGFSDYQNPSSGNIDKSGWSNWLNINYLNSHGNSASHIWGAFINKYKDVFAKHPEYLAEVDGKRPGYGKVNKLCVTNTQVQKLFVEYIRWTIDNNPNKSIYSIEPTDGAKHCTCSKCSALGSISNRVFHFSNIIAKEIKKSHPQKQLSILAYYQHADVPSFKVEDNIKVIVASLGFQTLYSPLSLANVWAKHHKNLGFYEYLGIPQWIGELPRTNTNYFLSMVNFGRKNNFDTYIFETGTNINNIIISSILSKLLMNPTLEWDDVYEKFLDDCFKDSKEPMRRLFTRWHSYSYYDSTDIHYTLFDLQEASKLAKNSSEILRINDIKAYIHYIILYLEWNKDRNNPKTSARYFDYLYNSQNRNIVNIKALLTMFLKTIKYSDEMTEKYKLPHHGKKWNVLLTDQQIQKNFAEDISKYPPQKFEHVTYKQAEKNIANSKKVGLKQYTLRLAQKKTQLLYLNHTKLTITPVYKNVNPTAISLYSHDGKFIQEHVVKSGQSIEFNVPKAGLYNITQYRIAAINMELKGDFNLVVDEENFSPTDKNLKVAPIDINKDNTTKNRYILIPNP